MPMTALAPSSDACCSISANASARVFSHRSVSSVMLPPTSVCSPAPMVPMMERDRTVTPRTTPRFLVTRYPSSANAVVVIAWLIGPAMVCLHEVASPQPGHSIAVEDLVIGDDGEIFDLRLRDQHAIEGIAVLAG